MNRHRRLVVLGVSLIAVASASSCATLTEYAVEGAVGAVTGEDVDRADRGEQGLNTDRSLEGARDAVYQVGPTPGWEVGFRAHTFTSSGYHQNRVCLQIPLELELGSLWSRQLPDPFVSSDRRDSPLFVQENNQGIDPGYVRLGEVRLVGPSPTAMIWRSAGILDPYGAAEGACPVLGLVSFGRPAASALILR